MYKDQFIAIIKVGDDILREKDGMVYLPFDSEYAIHMKNLSPNIVVVDSVCIDGEDVLDGKIYVYSNCTHILDRFPSGHRFKFVKKTTKLKKNRKDRIDDGIVRIQFHFEKSYCYFYKYWPPQPITITWESDSTNFKYSPSYTGFSYEDEGLITCNVGSGECCGNGVTVKGTFIGQDTNSKVMVFRLCGCKNVCTTRRKEKCPQCGKKSKSSYNYCPECGSRLIRS